LGDHQSDILEKKSLISLRLGGERDGKFMPCVETVLKNIEELYIKHDLHVLTQCHPQN
jgi:hypothetical protein